MPTHLDAVLIEKVQRARARMIFASANDCKEVLAQLEAHLPADVRLGRKLSELRSITRDKWDHLEVDGHLRDLVKEISTPGIQTTTDTSLQEALQKLAEDKEMSLRLLGVQKSTLDGWTDGKKPSAHNIKKILWIAELQDQHPASWLNDRSHIISAWKKGPAPDLLDASETSA